MKDENHADVIMPRFGEILKILNNRGVPTANQFLAILMSTMAMGRQLGISTESIKEGAAACLARIDDALPPPCFKSNPDYQAQAENDCEVCPYQEECIEHETH